MIRSNKALSKDLLFSPQYRRIMDAQLKHEILEHLANITFNVQSFEEYGPPASSIFVTRERGKDEELIIAGEYYEEYDELLKLMLERAKWNDRVSQQYLDSHVKEMIFKIRKQGYAKEVNDLVPYLDQLIADLDHFEPQTVYIPVLGLKIDNFAFPVGNFTFRRHSKALVDELVEKYRKVLSLEKSEPIQESKIDSFRGYLDRLKNTIVAERRFNYPIEANRALEIAEEDLRRVIDLFRYVIGCMFLNRNIASRPQIGLQDEIRFDTRLTFTFSNMSVQSEEKATGLIHTFYLSVLDHNDLDRYGFFLMSNILEKALEELTPYEEVLVRSLRLFSDSQTQFESENEFLGLFNCIENFVVPGARLKDSIPKTIALLIAKTPEERENKRIEFGAKYETRSAITHGSRHIVILNDDLKSLRKAALRIICWMIYHNEKFKTDKDLRRWLKNERLKIWPESSTSNK
jgi:hypothetical protein